MNGFAYINHKCEAVASNELGNKFLSFTELTKPKHYKRNIENLSDDRSSFPWPNCLSGFMWTSWPHFISCGISVLLIPSFLILSIYIDSFPLSTCNIRGILLCSQCLNIFEVHLEISYITLIDNLCLHNNAFTIMHLYSDHNRCVCIFFFYFYLYPFSVIKRWDLKLSIAVHEGVTPILIEMYEHFFNVNQFPFRNWIIKNK